MALPFSMTTVGLLVLQISLWQASAQTLSPPPSKPTSHTTRMVEGWTVHLDDRLLGIENGKLGLDAVALLQSRLADVARQVAPSRLADLRKVPIWLDLSHGRLTSMQYHPSAEWLAENDYDRKLAKGVHLPDAARFVEPWHNHVQPWCVLHELAHAYHDQILGFDEPRIKAAWMEYEQSGRGTRVLHVDGRQARHYAMTNHKEYFAEMSEAFFGANDFFPFVRGELMTAEPALFALLADIWGLNAGKEKSQPAK